MLRVINQRCFALMFCRVTSAYALSKRRKKFTSPQNDVLDTDRMIQSTTMDSHAQIDYIVHEGRLLISHLIRRQFGGKSWLSIRLLNLDCD